MEVGEVVALVRADARLAEDQPDAVAVVGRQILDAGLEGQVGVAAAVGEDVEAARELPGALVNVIGDDVTGSEGRLEDLAREEAPVARQGEVGFLQLEEVRGDLGEEQVSFGGGEVRGRAQQGAVPIQFVHRLDAGLLEMLQHERLAGALAHRRLSLVLMVRQMVMLRVVSDPGACPT